MPNPLEIEFERMLHSLNVAEEPTFALVLDLLHRTKFSGAVTLHCYQGVPKIVEMGRPIRIDLTRK